MSRITIICLLLVAVTALVFGQVVAHDFVSYDDLAFVVDNPHVRYGLTLDAVAWSFIGNVDYWRPLSLLAHMLDCDLYGLNPAGHHLSSLLLHLINTLLLFGVLRAFTAATWRSALVAALFALHPLHVESVAWVAERKDVLSTMFGLLALGAYGSYARRPSMGRYVRVLLMLAATLAAKPMLVTLPCLFLLLDVWPLNRMSRRADSPSWVLLLVEKIPFLALVSMTIVVTVIFQRDLGAFTLVDQIQAHQRVAHAVVSCVNYIGMTIWPSGLSAFHPHPYTHGNTPWSALHVVAAAGLLLGVSAAAIALIRRRWYPFVGWFWFLGTLVPVIGLVQVGLQGMADRYTYVPLIGLFIAASWGLGDLAGALAIRSASRRAVVGALVVALPAACAAESWAQARHWRDSTSLYEHALRVYPHDPVLNTFLGNVHLEADRPRRAIDFFEKATRSDPTFHDAWHNLGTAYVKMQRYDVAIGHYRTALQLRPGAAAHYALATALNYVGRTDEAIDHYRLALKFKRDYSRAWSALGVALSSKAQMDKAMACFREAIRHDPWYAPAQFNLGAAHEKIGDLDLAVHHYKEAVKIDRDFDAARTGMNRLLGQRPN